VSFCGWSVGARLHEFRRKLGVQGFSGPRAAPAALLGGRKGCWSERAGGRPLWPLFADQVAVNRLELSQ